MPGMDVFNSNAFSTISLTAAFQKMDYKPQLLGSLGIFTPRPSRTRDVFIERRSQTLSLIPTSAIGENPTPHAVAQRNGVSLRTVRLAKEATIYAESVQGVRAMGSETELETVQTEFLRNMAEVRDDMELTHEHHRLGAIKGIVLDSDGSTVIYNFWTEMGISQPTEVDFELDSTSTDVRAKCKSIVRAVRRGAKGALPPGAEIHALAGDAFYDALVSHPEVEKFYLNQVAARELAASGAAFESFRFEGITFHNYQGTDDNSTVAVGTDKVHFFPVGGRDVFQVAYAPAEFDPWINTFGQDIYGLTIPDRDRGAFVKGEMYSYPLFICARPECLQRGKRA